MKKATHILILLVILFIACMPSGIALAKDNGKLQKQIGDKVALETGDEATYIGMDKNGNEIWKAVLGDPVYIPGTSIKYDCQWYQDSGKHYYAGANDFTATVKNKKVEVTYNNKKSQWEPSLSIDFKNAKEAKTEPTLLAVDPINENYRNNTLKWDYGNGITRYLRIIEGMLLEYYIVEEEPEGLLYIQNNHSKDDGFEWHRPMYAFDADNKAITISETAEHNIILYEADAKERVVDAGKGTKESVKYPITIDPDTSFTTSSSDGLVHAYDWDVYLIARNKAEAYVVNTSSTLMNVGQTGGAGYAYSVDRSCIYFNTSAFPDALTISAASLKLYVSNDSSNTDFLITVQSGMPTYPHDPLVAGDYNYSLYSGDGGSLTTAGISTAAYSTITLNATGRGWVNKTGYTKFMLRSSRDISGTAPTGVELIRIWTYEKGAGYRPTLEVTYTADAPEVTALAASSISTTSARLNAVVGEDGGEDCQIRWGYGTTSQTSGNFTSYDTVTDWTSAEWSTGEYPYVDVSSLTDDETYYYRIQIKNSNSTVTSDEITFDTIAAVSLSEPTNLRAFPSATSVSMTWTKGYGSDTTLIRFSTTTFPAATTEGTQVYNSTGSTTEHTGLTAGMTYYYSAWGISGGDTSADYATAVVTTYAYSENGGMDFEYPDAIPGWFQSVNYEALSELEPIYSSINGVADSMDMPRATAWVGIMVGIIFIASIAALMIRGFIAAIIVALVLFVIMIGIGILPAWMLVLFIPIGLGAWALLKNMAGGGLQA